MTLPKTQINIDFALSADKAAGQCMTGLSGSTQVPDLDFYHKAGQLFLFYIVYSQPRAYIALSRSHTFCSLLLCIGLLLLVHRRDCAKLITHR